MGHRFAGTAGLTESWDARPVIMIGRGEPPQWVWVSAGHVQSVRARLAKVGLPLIGAALVAGIALVVVGLTLPTADSPINVIGVMIAGIGARVLRVSSSTSTVLAWSAGCSRPGGAGRSSAHCSRVSPR